MLPSYDHFRIFEDSNVQASLLALRRLLNLVIDADARPGNSVNEATGRLIASTSAFFQPTGFGWVLGDF